MMFVRGKSCVFVTLIAALVAILNSLPGCTAETDVWLAGTFKEVNTASPVIGHATMPLALAQAIVNAIPPKFLAETKEEGFDIPAIALAVEQMGKDEVFEITKDDYYLFIRKYAQPVPTDQAKPNRLVIVNPRLSLPIPLIVTGGAVSLLQMAYDVFDGMDDQLTHLIEQVKQTPPGLILKGEDKLLQTWLEIYLK